MKKKRVGEMQQQLLWQDESNQKYWYSVVVWYRTKQFSFTSDRAVKNEIKMKHYFKTYPFEFLYKQY